MITSIYRAATSRYDGITAGADEYVLDPLPGHRLVRTLDRGLTESPGLRDAAVITTDRFGLITGLNASACQLLNLTRRHAIGRSLLTFVGADRDKASRSLYAAAAGQFVQDEVVLRPRERKPLMVALNTATVLRGSSVMGLLRTPADNEAHMCFASSSGLAVRSCADPESLRVRLATFACRCAHGRQEPVT